MRQAIAFVLLILAGGLGCEHVPTDYKLPENCAPKSLSRQAATPVQEVRKDLSKALPIVIASSDDSMIHKKYLHEFLSRQGFGMSRMIDRPPIMLGHTMTEPNTLWVIQSVNLHFPN